MTDADLDRCYTRLATALGEAGEERSALFLAIVSLGLVARAADATEVLPVIEQAVAAVRAHSAAGPTAS